MTVNKRALKKIIKITLSIIPILIFVVMWLTNTIYYHMGDDEVMNTIAIGNYNGYPDEHLIYINSVIGYINKFLFNITSSINWFAIIYILSILILTYSLLFLFKKYTNYVVAFLLAVSVEIICIFWFTFTVISYFCAIAACLTLIDLFLSTERSKLFTTIECVSIAFLGLISYGLRSEAFLSTLFLACPIILLLKRNFYKRIPAIASVIIVLVGITAMVLVNNHSYSSPGWVKYKTFNSARSSVYDYPIMSYEDNVDYYTKIDFTKTDTECIKDTFTADNKVYSTSKLYNIAKKTPTSTRYSINLRDFYKDLRENSTSTSVALITILTILLFVVLSVVLIILTKKKRLLVLQSITTMVVIGATFVIRRPLPRVVNSLALIGMLSLIYLFLRQKKELKSSVKRYVTIIISLLFVAQLFIYGGKTVTNANYFSKYIKQQSIIHDYANKHKDILLIAHRPWEWLYYKPVSQINNNTIYNLMGTGEQYTFSPLYYEQLSLIKKHNGDRLLQNFLKDKKTYLVSKREDNVILKYIKNYYRDHYGQTVKCKVIKDYKKAGIIIFKFKKR